MNEDKPRWWTFFAWPIVGAALALSVLGAMTIGLFVLPFATAGLLALLKWGGNRKSKKMQIAAGLFFFVIIVIVVRAGSPTNPVSSESGRVQYSFRMIFSALSKGEGVSTRPHLPPVRVDVVSYPDGSKASLWVPNSAMLEPRSNCFAVDVVREKSGSAGFFEASCLKPKSEVILERQGLVVVGYVRMTKAHFATITSGGVTVEAPITYGYFIFPSIVSGDPKVKFTISFIDPGGATCRVEDVPAPGGATSIQCVIA